VTSGHQAVWSDWQQAHLDEAEGTTTATVTHPTDASGPGLDRHPCFIHSIEGLRGTTHTAGPVYECAVARFVVTSRPFLV
jgi:hypothetical protein